MISYPYQFGNRIRSFNSLYAHCMDAILISDLHIDDTNPNILRRLNTLIEHETRNIDALYILGDLVEVWVGDDDRSKLAEALRTTLKKATRNCQVYLMHGNRDFLFGDRFAEEIGATLIDDPTVITINGNRVVITHGDAYCTKDSAYQQMRQMFRSSEWKSEILDKSLKERRNLATNLRNQSRLANQNKADNIMDVTNSEVMNSLKTNDASTVIHGHTHRPGIYDLEGNNRFVLGDWGRCGWLVRSSTKELTLECFSI